MSDLKSMMLVTVPFSPETNEKSFRMIPVKADCPYIDAVYWKDKKVLEVVTPFKKNEYNMFVKLDDNGEPEKRKTPGTDEHGNPKVHKQERKITEVMMNYYIIEQVEIIAFIETFAINANKVDYMSIIAGKDAIIAPPAPSIIMPS